MFRTFVPAKKLWKVNTKDAFGGAISPLNGLCTLSVLGHRRKKSSHITVAPKWLIITRRYTARILFRRVSPVETRVYAFARNSFAIAAIGILIFRTVTALQQAQNEIKTRVLSETCDKATSVQKISILSDRLIYDPRWNSSLPEQLNMSVLMVSIDGRSGKEVHATCPLLWTQPFNNTFKDSFSVESITQNRALDLYRCNGLVYVFQQGGVHRNLMRGAYGDSFVLRIEVTGIPGGVTFNSQMPQIWLMNQWEIDRGWSNIGEVRAYLPPIKLRRGSYIEAGANLITRRLIKSSIMRDIIFSFKSDYRALSLYPIVEPTFTKLDSSNGNVAIAVIHPDLNPGLMYHRNQAEAWSSDGSPKDVCDYIEDYRAGTILDVIGSVGGLFALLQAAHLMLFGRPLFWGLTGAMTIAPFGLIGGYFSRSFRQRLREEYHGTCGSDQDGANAIQIVKFLRDFVIDFGPADLDPEGLNKEVVALPSTLSANSEESAGTRIPLIQMDSVDTGVPGRVNNANEDIDHCSDRDRIESVV